MRVAALFDIHGNLPALDAVLQDIRRDRVDQIVVGGDVVPGPMPHACLERLLSLDVPVRCIHGNGEVAVLAELDGNPSDAVPEHAREMVRWSSRHLQPGDEAVLRRWPETVRLHLPPLGDVVFCHATPRSVTEIFTRLTPEDRLAPLFDPLDATLVVCGHTHMQFDRMVGRTRVVNAGSVGMPFGTPGANWLLLAPDVQLRHTHYDLEEAARQVAATTFPNAADFAAQFIVNPRSEAEMLEVYARSEVR
jgi:predicted phosphodiesterase